jgi:hypothetical protein
MLQVYIKDYCTHTLLTRSRSCRLLFIAFRGSLSKHPITLFQYLDWVPLMCECRVLAVGQPSTPDHF